MTETTAKQKILVIRFGAMGDLIHVSPSLNALKSANPEAEIHFLTSPVYKDLLETIPSIHSVWCYDKKTGYGNLFTLARALNQEEFDMAINLHPSFRTQFLLFFMNPKDVVSYQKEKLNTKGKQQRALTRKHAIEDFYGSFQEAFHLPDATTETLIPDDNTLDSAKRPVVGIIPGVGSKRGNRAWIPDYYVDLIQKIHQKHPEYHIRLFGGADEAALATNIIEESIQKTPELQEKLESQCGTLSILETKDALAECSVIIGGDTGPIHLASLAGCNIIGIYGPTSIQRTGPVSHGSVETLLPKEHLSCWPCELPECPLKGEEYLVCMKQISSDDVMGKLTRYLD